MNNFSKIEREKYICVPYETKDKPKVEVSADIQSSLDTIQGLQNQIAEEAKKITQKKEVLEEQQSQIDKEISDIYHFIAFEKVSVCKWVKIYKFLSEKLKTRAKIKHQYRILQTIISDFEGNKSLSAISADIQNETYDEYVPRTEVYKQLKSL